MSRIPGAIEVHDGGKLVMINIQAITSMGAHPESGTFIYATQTTYLIDEDYETVIGLIQDASR